MTKCLVIGGGLAGLSAAVHLVNNGFSVKLIEASPKLGGRTYSFVNKQNNDVIDNGQHIMMGCYYDTLELLKIIGASDRAKIQDNLEVNFIKRSGELFPLRSGSGIFPLNLLKGIMKYGAVGLKDRLKIIDFFVDLIFCEPSDLSDLTVAQWLERERQDEEIIKALWDILAVATLNTTIDKACAELFARVLKEVFLTTEEASKIVLPLGGLSTVFCEKAEEFILAKGGDISVSEKAVEFVYENKLLKKVITDKDTYTGFDYVVSAIPFHAVEKINGFREYISPDTIKFSYSSILTMHIWLDRNPFEKEFYGLIDSKVHWLFNHKKHITLVTSAAEEFIDFESEKIKNTFISELENYFPIFKKDMVLDSMVIKEKRATFIPEIESEKQRKNLTCSLENLILAGDWVHTGLPSTIEGAIRSGKTAFEKILLKR